MPELEDLKQPSVGTFTFDLKSLPKDLNDINNNLTLFIEEVGLDYPDLLLGDSKILKVTLNDCSIIWFGLIKMVYLRFSLMILAFI